jgi:Uncharacterised nucleotidyltransferase
MKMTDSIRLWLIAALTHDELPPLAVSAWQDAIGQAGSDGVLVLLEHRLARHPAYSGIPAGLLGLIQQAAKQDLMEQLPFHSEQKKIFKALNQAQIPFLVMKGAALGNWLYDSPSLRSVTDIDLWFADRQTVSSLDGVLRPLGYQPAESAGGLSSFELAFDKALNGRKIRIDAHWAMFNSAILSASVGYEKAYSRAMPVSAQAQDVKALGITDALINSIGHRALKYLSGQADTLKWLYDQYLLFNALDAAQWQELTDRCNDAGISDLALDAIGQSQRQFNIRIPPQVIDALKENAGRETVRRSWFQSWPRYQWHEMRAVSPKLSERAVWLGQRLWPNPEAMRDRYGSGDPAWKFMFRRIGIGLKRFLGG